MEATTGKGHQKHARHIVFNPWRESQTAKCFMVDTLLIKIRLCTSCVSQYTSPACSSQTTTEQCTSSLVPALKHQSCTLSLTLSWPPPQQEMYWPAWEMPWAFQNRRHPSGCHSPSSALHSSGSRAREEIPADAHLQLSTRRCQTGCAVYHETAGKWNQGFVIRSERSAEIQLLRLDFRAWSHTFQPLWN